MNLAKAVANQFLSHADIEGDTDMAPMKVLKLVYIAHGWSLADLERPLINEKVQAWPYGPVVPSVYHEFKEFGDGRILRRATERGRDGVYEPALLAGSGGDADRALVERVWREYGGFDGLQLSAMTHMPGTPWYVVTDGGKRVNREIPDPLIREHYLERAKQSG